MLPIESEDETSFLREDKRKSLSRENQTPNTVAAIKEMVFLLKNISEITER